MEILEIVKEEIFQMIRTRLSDWYYIMQDPSKIVVWDQTDNDDKKVATVFVNLRKATIELRVAYSRKRRMSVPLADPKCFEICEEWVMKLAGVPQL